MKDAKTAAEGERETRTLYLNKGTEMFAFRYQVGDEREVLTDLIEKVNDKAVDFDWFDAATVSHQLGKEVAAEMKPFILKKKAEG